MVNSKVLPGHTSYTLLVSCILLFTASSNSSISVYSSNPYLSLDGLGFRVRVR